MRIIAFMNQKGGVGKTTTTANLGAALAEAGSTVCLIDLDPQAHLTINYGVDTAGGLPSLYEVLVDDQPIAEALRQVGDNITLVPSSIDLAAAEIELVSIIGRETLLKRHLEAAGFNYDFVLLDCPPSLGLLTINALAVATEVIIPMQPHFLALQGVGKLLETVQLVNRRMNPLLRVTGIVLTLFDSNAKLSTEVVGDLSGFIDSATGKKLPWSGARIFNTRIRRNIKLAESPSFGQDILRYEPSSNGAADYRALAKEVLEMTQGGGGAARPMVAPPVVEAVPEETAPAEAVPVEAVSEEIEPAETVSEEAVPEEAVPAETAPVETVPEETSPMTSPAEPVVLPPENPEPESARQPETPAPSPS